jgi:site-specific recombinase XerD
VIVDLIGKGQRLRSVAIPDLGKAALDSWIEAAGITVGRLFRPVNKAGRVTGAGMSPHAIYAVVRRYTGRLGWDVAPHDLRRAQAKLAHRGGAQLQQIQLSLGHLSVRTTERYFGLEEDWADAACDRLGLRMAARG